MTVCYKHFACYIRPVLKSWTKLSSTPPSAHQHGPWDPSENQVANHTIPELYCAFKVRMYIFTNCPILKCSSVTWWVIVPFHHCCDFKLSVLLSRVFDLFWYEYYTSGKDVEKLPGLASSIEVCSWICVSFFVKISQGRRSVISLSGLFSCLIALSGQVQKCYFFVRVHLLSVSASPSSMSVSVTHTHHNDKSSYFQRPEAKVTFK